MWTLATEQQRNVSSSSSCHKLGLNRPVLALSNSVFRSLPSCLCLIYDSASFLAFYFCSFLLHIVASLICIFLVPCQLAELSALPKVHFFCGQKVCNLLFFWRTSSQLMSVVLYLFVWLSKFQFHIEEWVQPVH